MATIKETLSDVLVFDTRKYVRNLRSDGGFSEKQADAHADGLQEALRGVATKADIEVVKAQLAAVMQTLEAHQEQMRGLRQTMMIGFSMNGGLILLAGLLLGLR